MASGDQQGREPIHFGLWAEMTVLMEFLSSDEKGALLSALGIPASEFVSISAQYREIMQGGLESEKTIIFHRARREAASGGREQAIERFNRFLDSLNSEQ